MKSLIFGYGQTGKSFEKYLTNKNIVFDIYDDDVNKLPEAHQGKHISPAFNSLENYKDIYISPGIKLQNYLTREQITNLNLKSDLDIFFLEHNSFKIGITGTNGKSTLVHFLEQALNHSSSAIALGNIGNPVLENLNHQKKYSVIEASSYQLEKMESNLFDLAIITNIEQDHIKFHGTFKRYKEAKLRICRDKIKTILCDGHDYETIAKKIAKDLEPNSNYDDLKLSSLPHRLEEFAGRFIDDSKSTNSSSLKHAISKLDFSGTLIICGDPDKECLDEIIIKGPKRVYIFGKHRKDLLKTMKHENIKDFATLDEALKDLKSSNDSSKILFSPGNPSGKDFQNFSERGQYFKNKVLKYFGE
tara:strand:+ start:1141 stop:2220 length:1080 start_codon:yes stop_codon:yes gene_type:complete